MDSSTLRAQIEQIYDSQRISGKKGLTSTNIVILSGSGIICLFLSFFSGETGFMYLGIGFIGIAIYGIYSSPPAKSFQEKEKHLIKKYFDAADGNETIAAQMRKENKQKGLTDSLIDAIVNNRVFELKLREKAMTVLGLDETQIAELPPVCINDYYVQYKDQLVVKGLDDDINRTSSYRVTWLFFTTKQLCIHQYTFNILNETKKERTEQYFWKDVSNLTINDENEVSGKVLKYILIKVSGDEYKIFYKNTPEMKRAIQGMIAYYRDIKSL